MNIGIVGARGLSTMAGFESIEGVNVTAFCDLNQVLLKEISKKYNIKNTYRIYEDMLESDIDAVVISTPMQLHVPQTIAALQAGKHVLSEITAGVTLDELWWLIEAVESSGKVYMMAENCCYFPEVQIINNMVEQGLFGKLYYSEGEYIHDIKNLVKINGSYTWRKYWQLGKRGNFYPTHSLGPIMKWFKNDRIKSICCMGSGHNTAPEFKQDDTCITLCQTESGNFIKLRIDCLSERPHNNTYFSLQGTLGCYEAPRGLGDDHKIWLKGMDESTDKAKWRPLSDFNEYLPERYKSATDKQRNAGHNGSDFFIVKDFVDAILHNKKPYIDVYDAAEWTAVALISELSVQNGGKPMAIPDFRNSKTYTQQEYKL